jgi:glycosyltransferase involved in cell wall biosynthesis
VSAPEVAVVVATYRRSDRLPRLVAALEAQTLAPDRFEVLLVDNGSHDDTGPVLEDLARRSPLQLRVLTVEENHGPAPARNLGWRAARAPLVAFTDDDCVPRPDWLAQALSSAAATPDLAVLQGATLRPRGAYPYGPRTVYRETITPSPYFEGSNLVFPRAVLERTGGFDEAFHFGGEDTAAGWAAIEDGGAWVFDETCVVTHDIVERPLRWHLMMAWREGNLVDVAARHRAFRDRGLWRRHVHRPWNLAYALGVVATIVALALGRPLALLGWLPWLGLRGLPWWPPHLAARELGWALVHDAVVLAGMVRGSVRNRIVVV